MTFNLHCPEDKLWTSKEADVITGGTSNRPWVATNIALNINDIFPGDLFFATREDDVALAFERGAAVIAAQANLNIPDAIADLYPIMRVPCSYESLRAMAKAARFRTHSLVVAVQGFEQRRSLSNALCAVSDMYEGGRHLSASLAAMPEDCDFSLFGLSPNLRPDVTIIHKPGQLKDISIFETMPKNGIVIMNNEDSGFAEIAALAKAAGLSNILTFGNNDNADAYMVSQIKADNGVQTTCNILGQNITVQTATNMAPHMPTMAHNVNMLLTGYMLVKLSDMKLAHLAQDMAESYMSAFAVTEAPNASPVSLLTPKLHKAEDEAIFRVKNMVDTGQGRRTLILDQGAPDAREQDFTLPSRIAGLDVVRAGKKVSIFKNARKAVEKMLNIKSLSPIIPDVLTPGDYVVFKSQSQYAEHSTFSQALRMES